MTKGREKASSVEGTAGSRRASWRRQSLPETETALEVFVVPDQV